MILPKEAVLQFKSIYEKEHGQSISYEVAEAMANRVYVFFKTAIHQTMRKKVDLKGGEHNDNVKKID